MSTDPDQNIGSNASEFSNAGDIFDHHISLAQADTHAFRPRAAVYLLSARGAPVLLATTANLRHAIEMRLGSGRPAQQTDYRAITSHISWRYVHHAFAANWWCLLAVRKYHPSNYRTLLAWRPAWFLRVDTGTGAAPPSIDVLNQSGDSSGSVFGPFASRRVARELADWLLEQFDLCRYEDILRRYPHGQACAYKEMGKCPAPCDGSISIETYRSMVQDAAELLAAMAPAVRPSRSVSELKYYHVCESQMKQAAVEFDFRRASKLKQRLESLTARFASLPPGWAPVRQWKYMILQRGSTRRWIEPWIVRAGVCTPLPQVETRRVLSETTDFIQQLQRHLQDDSAPAGTSHPPTFADDLMAMVTYHMNRTRDPGLYLSSADLIDGVGMVNRLEDWLNTSDTAAVMEWAGNTVQSPESRPEASTES